ncbi:DUF559 domain-containing protein [Bifidobacterium sp. ESL0790]|uniref:DUF559 domain-containing protein n=1 Tax=Bifidobacterium sp. ESL0790 TaxID=2983233 RepID=UPI0023F80890|nr:DUF559 domain-containing protein [Bifidobacterium sp. ESL0790]WEV72916.1 DUF559 domain-containing protein [Bifidobacterium sp. ESL0790]
MRHQAWRTQQDAMARCRKFAEASGANHVFALGTALQLLGVNADAMACADGGVDVDFCQRRRSRHFPAGMRCHLWNQLRYQGCVTTVAGLRCTTPEATFAQLAQVLRFEPLVTLADGLMRRDRLLKRTTPERLRSFVTTRRYLTCRSTCLRALNLAEPDTDSSMETRLRLEMLRRGFPKPVVNFEVDDPVEGTKYLDIAYPQYRVAVEYNGQHHLRQYLADSVRLNRLAAGNWLVFAAWGEMFNDDMALDMFFNNVLEGLRGAGMTDELTPMGLWECSDGRRKPHKSVDRF